MQSALDESWPRGVEMVRIPACAAAKVCPEAILEEMLHTEGMFVGE